MHAFHPYSFIFIEWYDLKVNYRITFKHNFKFNSKEHVLESVLEDVGVEMSHTVLLHFKVASAFMFLVMRALVLEPHCLCFSSGSAS